MAKKSEYHHRYSILQCPDCKSDLTKPDSVTLEYHLAGANQGTPTRLDEQGNLVDVDDIIANGYHSGTSCAACGEGLDEHEII